MITIAKSNENTLETTRRGTEYRTNGYWVELTDNEDGTFTVSVGDERCCDESKDFNNLNDAIEDYEQQQSRYDLPPENDYWNKKYER